MAAPRKRTRESGGGQGPDLRGTGMSPEQYALRTRVVRLGDGLAGDELAAAVDSEARLLAAEVLTSCV